MLPKEHGAWNALGLSFLAGWAALGIWSFPGAMICLFWGAGFLLRGPISIIRQYQKADPPRARRARVYLGFLLLVLGSSGPLFMITAPQADRYWVLGFGFPVGILVLILSVLRRNLRSILPEVFGFAGLCALAPAIYLSAPQTDLSKAGWIYGSVAGYFVLALFYVKVRQKWLALFRQGHELSPKERLAQGWRLVAPYALWAVVIHHSFPVSWVLLSVPAFAVTRVLGGLLWGQMSLPLMKLGVREMTLSFFYLFLVLWTLKSI